MDGKRGITLFIIYSIVIIATIMPVAFGIIDQSPKGVEEWFEKICYKEEKKTKLHFYFHDVASGKTPTAVLVAQANMTATSPTVFGSLFMADDLLTVGPEPNSTEVGRAQGIYASADTKNFGLLMDLNFVFTSGKYNGSTLSMLARNSIFNRYREMSIVGGTGYFRLARGIATSQTYMFNLTSFDAIVEYNVVVIHH